MVTKQPGCAYLLFVLASEVITEQDFQVSGGKHGGLGLGAFVLFHQISSGFWKIIAAVLQKTNLVEW